jgi:hypothetical protein
MRGGDGTLASKSANPSHLITYGMIVYYVLKAISGERRGVQMDAQIEHPYVMKSEGFILFRADARKDSGQVGPKDWKKVTSSVL